MPGIIKMCRQIGAILQGSVLIDEKVYIAAALSVYLKNKNPSTAKAVPISPAGSVGA